jgi:hypothetical protein
VPAATRILLSCYSVILSTGNKNKSDKVIQQSTA